MLRQPAVAGYFYQGSASLLKAQVGVFLTPTNRKIRAIGAVCPHAGLVYSGSVAGAVYSAVEIPDVIVLIGPNHTGLGAAVSIMSGGAWKTPLGTVPVNEKLAAAILQRSRIVQDDIVAHLREHSLEVQLPFLQCMKQEFSIVPIQMLDTRLETCIELGNAVAAAIVDCGLAPDTDKLPRSLVVASSDMSHYVSADEATRKDHMAIERILKLDGYGLHNIVRSENISMCGYGPVVAMLTACKTLGAAKAELIKYATSGDVSGDYNQVVGYAGVAVY